MSEPLPFTSNTPRFELPLLFAGQSQKEFFVNEALLRADILLHCVIEGETETPPPAPAAGQCWLIGGAPTGTFAGHAGEIAGWTESGWRFIEALDGLRAFDRSSGSFRLFSGTWRQPSAPAEPTGGAVIDVELRAAFSQLLQKLTAAGVLGS